MTLPPSRHEPHLPTTPAVADPSTRTGHTMPNTNHPNAALQQAFADELAGLTDSPGATLQENQLKADPLAAGIENQIAAFRNPVPTPPAHAPVTRNPRPGVDRLGIGLSEAFDHAEQHKTTDTNSTTEVTNHG